MANFLRRLALVVLLVPLLTASRAAPLEEYEVKAAFIHNIAKFIDWPAPAGGAGTMRLCVLGHDPFGGALDNLQDKPIGNMVWQVAPAATGASLRECRVLFIASSESGNLRRILASLRGSAVLTVGDSSEFAEAGVMVNFYLEQNKVRFEVNVDATRRAGLKIGSQLLKLARIVYERQGAP